MNCISLWLCFFLSFDNTPLIPVDAPRSPQSAIRRWMLYTSVLFIGPFIYFIFVEQLKPLDFITGSSHRSSQVSLLFFQRSMPLVNTFTAHRHVLLFRVASLVRHIHSGSYLAFKRYVHYCAARFFFFDLFDEFLQRCCSCSTFRRVTAHVLVIYVSPLESIFRPFFDTRS